MPHSLFSFNSFRLVWFGSVCVRVCSVRVIPIIWYPLHCVALHSNIGLVNLPLTALLFCVENSRVIHCTVSLLIFSLLFICDTARVKWCVHHCRWELLLTQLNLFPNISGDAANQNQLHRKAHWSCAQCLIGIVYLQYGFQCQQPNKRQLH